MNFQCQTPFKRSWSHCSLLAPCRILPFHLWQHGPDGNFPWAIYSKNEPLAGTAGCCQTHRDWAFHSCLSDLRSVWVCKHCWGSSFAWKRMDCPEPNLGLGACRWLIKSFTRFGNRETGHPDVKNIQPFGCVWETKKAVESLFLAKDCTIPVVRIYRDPNLWETLTVKATWKAQHQWPFPPGPFTGCATVFLAADHGAALQRAPCMAGHFHPTAIPQACTRCNSNMPSCNLACVTRCWEAFVQPQSVFSC